MKTNRKILALAAALTLITFQSCQKSDTNNLQQAQMCLNKAAASEAKACVTGISSNTSSYASSLKCAAIFISEGFGAASSFTTAIDSLNSASGCGGGCSSTVSAISSLKFHSSGGAIPNSTDVATAAEAFTVCNASNVKFYSQISSLFNMGTLTASFAVANPTETDIKNALGSISPATLGNLVLSTSASVCTDIANASDSTKKYCADLASAINGSTDPAIVGACLVKILKKLTCP